MKPTQRAYTAAFLDGEGGIYRAGWSKKRWVVRLYQNDPAPLISIQSWFGGGKIYLIKNGQSVFCIGKQAEVLRFCRLIQKHCIVKRSLVREVVRDLERSGLS